MKFSIREIRTPDDYAQIAKLLNSMLSEETSAEILADEDAKIPAKGMLHKNERGWLAGFDRYRIVAVDVQGSILGYGISWRAPWTAEGELNHSLVVDPNSRNQGIGRQLYSTLEKWAQAHGASKLNYEVSDDEEHSLAFAKKQGYEIERHTFESVLKLTSFDRALLHTSPVPLSIVPFSELGDPDKENKLYELYKETSFDIPGFTGDYFDFHEWKKWTLDLPGSKPEYVFIALDQDKYVGVAHLLFRETTQSMYHEYTGVRRAYRGQGLGMALKLKSIELALQLNIAYLRTNNDSLNIPMLKINRDDLGFTAVPGDYKMVKKISIL
ncbi:GNAT family N-acetyltransferase [Paenibacillus bouchesdurhonensis]|uniref:GNAT family N-acetyltransferase n=1 Tax=Paenibacillus bouchesdurhonensis TaxID=1870990 RepID=UPI000DA612EF|nr:GNAT family N-acetyltransferase [Paenibacillus bouchesdurhonensis]